jgi:hypothetical protein
MTQAQVDKVIADAAKRGIEVSQLDATTFLGARELLAKDPENKLAREVVEESMQQFTTGKEPTGFARFILPIFETDEELAASDKQRHDYLEIYRRYSLVGIAEGDYTAAQAFQAKHALTAERFMAMTDTEIKALAA